MWRVLLFCVLVATPSWADPTYDSVGTNLTGTNTSGSFSATVGTVANGLLVLAVQGRTDGTNANILSTATFNSVSLTKLLNTSVGTQWSAEIWYLVAPAAGAHTLAWTAPTNGSAMTFSVITVAGAHQTTPFRNAGLCANNSSGTTAAVTISSAATDLVIDSLLVTGASTLTKDATQTQIGSTLVPTANSFRGGTSYKTGEASSTMQWTFTTNLWAICAGSIQPPASASRMRRKPVVMQ